MKKWKSLRGRGVIHQIRLRGSRFRGEFMQCSSQVLASDSPGISVGFLVPRRTHSAVRRNRLKRLMREAFRKEQDVLFDVVKEKRLHASILFFFSGKKNRNANLIRFKEVHEDVAKFVRLVLLKL